MESVGVAELKARLSHYLARVRMGEEIVVSERGCAIAKIIAIDSRGGSESESRHMERLEREGRVRLGPGRVPDEFFEKSKPDDHEGLSLRYLIDERGSGH